MAQFGFFDADKRLSALSAKGDPLVGISALVCQRRSKNASAGRSKSASRLMA